MPLTTYPAAKADELKARIAKTLAFVESFKPAQIDGTEDKTVVLKRATGDITYQGLPYLLEYVQPNVYFHCVTAYAILRHCGVKLGKEDYLGKPFEPMPQLLAIAEYITKTLAICMRCGNPAKHTQRLTGSDDLIVVGAAGMYEARCRRHFDPTLSVPGLSKR